MNAYKYFETLSDRCKYIFNIIQKYGPLTKNQLLVKTQLKLTTLNRDIKNLIARKMIIETATAESTGGRKPALYDVNPGDFYMIGIDISRTYTQIIITNLKFRIMAEKRIDDAYEVNEVIKIIPVNVSDLIKASNIDKSMIVGIGIGIVMELNTKVLYTKLIATYQVPVSIDNGANAAVIGEHFLGFGKDKKNIAYIHCGVGIRTGVISSDILIRSINSSEDALGHMIVGNHGDLCPDGNDGCVETYASIINITQKFICQEGKIGKRILNKNLSEISYIDVCHLAENNNTIAKKIISDSALHFGIGLANFIRLLDPQLIILSGPLIQHSQLFYDECKKVALEQCHVINNTIKFNKGGYFENYSISVGASIMVIQGIINS